MQFISRKRRQPPAVIIISLIDILIVVLIFLMLTTTFKQQPALKLALPQSKQSKTGANADNDHVVVTVAKQEPHLYLGAIPVTSDRLQAELAARVAKNPKTALSIRADTDAPFGQIIKVMDIAKTVKISNVSAFTKQPGQP
jgi:biopolymer transport protein ExbD